MDGRLKTGIKFGILENFGGFGGEIVGEEEDLVFGGEFVREVLFEVCCIWRLLMELVLVVFNLVLLYLICFGFVWV